MKESDGLAKILEVTLREADVLQIAVESAITEMIRNESMPNKDGKAIIASGENIIENLKLANKILSDIKGKIK